MEPTVPTEQTATESSGLNLQWWDNWDEVIKTTGILIIRICRDTQNNTTVNLLKVPCVIICLQHMACQEIQSQVLSCC